MSANIITPTDVLTGLPHPILSTEPVDDRENDFVDYHHHNFPRRSPDLLPQFITNPNAQPEEYGIHDIASIAVRVCRGQLLQRSLHEVAHKRLLGPELPKTIDEKYNHVVRACSGLVSRWAIDLRRPDDDLLVYMDDLTFAKVTNPRALCGERFYYDRPANFRRRIIGSFLLQYALEQDMSHISPLVVEEFLETSVQARRIELGNLLLKDALDNSLAPVATIHQQLKKQGMVQAGKEDMRASIRKFIHPERLPAYRHFLHSKLTA